MASASVRILAGEGHYFEETVTPEKIKKLLNNPSSGQVGIIEKTDGMKYLLAMMSKGRNVAEYYPDVVKNVIVKSVEVKKLVYMYLVHHADANDECRELALLAINSFQRDLADSNQLIRALALRVMTSIRVRDIVQIQIMAISKCATDSSPYVRKTAAHSLPKIFALAPDVRSELEDIIGKLLMDRATMVLGSALCAYSEVCPTKFELLHEHFRKLCQMMADIDEWGQVMAMTVLTRYCRDQFTTPLARDGSDSGGGDKGKGGDSGKKKRGKSGFYSSDSDSGSDSGSEQDQKPPAPKSDKYALDEDHLLFLRTTLSLLHSRNAAVVLAVAAAHFHCGRPERDSPANRAIGRALVRVLRCPRELQYVVMQNIITISEDRPGIFEPHLKSFFCRVGEPQFYRLQKLQVLANIATEDNASKILKEVEAYVTDTDKAFVCAAVRCVGKIATLLPDVADRCLRGLMGLVSSQYEEVVAEGVVVIRQLLQQHPEHDSIIMRLSRKLEHTRVPAARAAIVWILGEFQAKERVAKMAPDALRKLVKGFRSEDVTVKNQIVNLAVKMALRLQDSGPVTLLARYVLDLARYDLNYDLRDRARMMRALLFSGADGLRERAAEMLLAPKPAPRVGHIADGGGGAAAGSGLAELSVSSLSHLVNHAAPHYQPLAEWPHEKPDPSVRDERKPDSPRGAFGGSSRRKGGKKHKEKAPKAPKPEKGFYDSTSSEEEDDDEGGGSSSDDSGSGSDSSSGGSASDSDSDSGSGSESDSSSGGSSSDSDSGSSSESDGDKVKPSS